MGSLRKPSLKDHAFKALTILLLTFVVDESLSQNGGFRHTRCATALDSQDRLIYTGCRVTDYRYDKCYTVSGSDDYKYCDFPFTFNGVKYYSCATWVYGGGNNGRQWCSTRTDSNGNYIKGYWGFCNSGCAAVPEGSATAVRATRYNSEDGTTIEDDEDTGDIVVDLVEEPAENAP